MIFDAFDSVDWLGIVVAWLVAFGIAFVWFLPPVLGRRWAAHVSGYAGIPEQELLAGNVRALVLWLLGMLLNAIALGLIATSVDAESVGDGLALGLVAWVGFGATLSSWPAIFARQPWGWWAINNGAFALMQLAMGAILGAFA